MRELLHTIPQVLRPISISIEPETSQDELFPISLISMSSPLPPSANILAHRAKHRIGRRVAAGVRLNPLKSVDIRSSIDAQRAAAAPRPAFQPSPDKDQVMHDASPSLHNLHLEFRSGREESRARAAAR